MRSRSCYLALVFFGFLLLALFFIPLINVAEYKPDVLTYDEVSKHASYKSVLEHADGSIDVIFNLPGYSELARKIRDNGKIKKRVTFAPTIKNNQVPALGSPKNRKASGKRTLYPVTLNTPYLINNPRLCKGDRKPVLLIVVHTATDHFKRRRSIRQTWANKNILSNGGLKIVFLFGKTKDKKTQIMLENESVVYHDIVQGNFHDSYQNLTHKGVLAYRWISDFCPDAELVVKVDDDVFVNIFLLLDYYLPLYRKSPRSMSCQVRPKGTSQIMRGKSKWQVGRDEFKNMTHYPVTYCNGYFVIISANMIKELYRVSFLTPFFWVDDVYLYGLLPYKAGKVQFKDLGRNLTLNQEHGLKCFSGDKPCSLLAAYAMADGFMEKLWYAAINKYHSVAEKYLPKELLMIK